MTEMDRERQREEGATPPLGPEEERLVRRIDAVWRAPAATPARRVAFQRRLDARISASRGGVGLRRPALAVAVACAAIALAAAVAVQRAGREAGPERVAGREIVPAAGARSDASARGEAIYALVTEDPSSAGETDLPAEYVAIASLLVDE